MIQANMREEKRRRRKKEQPKAWRGGNISRSWEWRKAVTDSGQGWMRRGCHCVRTALSTNMEDILEMNGMNSN